MARCGMSGALPLIVFLSLGLLISFSLVKTQENNIRLTEENWFQINEGEWMIKFYAPWCPACRNIAQTWNEFADAAIELGIKVAEVDVTQDSGVSGRFMVSSLPTIYHVINGEYRKYPGGRSVKEFVEFIKEKKWKEIEAVSSWKSPNSFLMKCLGYMLKLSTFLRDAHVLLTETYGLPAWGSYGIFGLVTVCTGLLLGVLIVLITDYVYKPEYSQAPPPAESDTTVHGQVQPEEVKQDEKEQVNEESELKDDTNIENTEEIINEAGKIADEAVEKEDKAEDEQQKESEVAEENEPIEVEEEEPIDKEKELVETENSDGIPDEKDGVGDQEEKIVVDEVIEDKEQDEDHEHTEVRKRNPTASAD